MRSQLLGSSLLLLALAACANKPDAAAPQTPHGPAHGEPATTQTSGAVVPPGEAKVGDKTTCPVSGEEFVVSETSPKAEYEGKTYYFCCSGCKAKFESDPKKFGGVK